MPNAKNVPYSASSPTNHHNRGATSRCSALRRAAQSHTSTPTGPATSARAPKRSRARISSGDRSRIHVSMRRNQSGEASHSPIAPMPCGSTRGNTQGATRAHGMPSPSLPATHTMRTQADAAKSHNGMSTRRNRSATTVPIGRRSSDVAKRLPDTKNMAGIAAKM